MTSRLVRIDLSDRARDFRAVAVEPGVPMLDSAGNNAAVISGWLGRFAARPEWDRGFVHFCAPAESSGKVACRPVTAARLHGPLRDELAELRTHLEAARPQSQFDRLLHQTLCDALHTITNDPKRADVGCCFLEYRDEQGRWRLLWCPGYERMSKEPATGRICGRSRCRLLYAHRPGYSAKCPACDPEAAARKVRQVPWKWIAPALVLALLLLLFGLWWLSREEPATPPPADEPKLVVEPAEVVLWTDETLTLDRVALEGEEGKSPQKVDYAIAVASGEDVVAVEDGKQLKALKQGTAELRITAVDMDGPGDGIEAIVPVTVTELDRVFIEPAEVTLDMGDTTPKFAVMAQGEAGEPRRVEAELESLDPEILAPHPVLAGSFFAKKLGGTSVRAFYMGREGFAKVSVRGERFREVDAKLNERTDDFDVTLHVLAAASQGPLEYRVYLPDTTPPDNWVEAELTDDGQHREVTLASPKIPYGPRNARYQLIIEARDPAGTSQQQYPFSFRLVIADIEAADGP